MITAEWEGCLQIILFLSHPLPWKTVLLNVKIPVQLFLLSIPVFSSYGSGFNTNYPIISELITLQFKIPWLLIDELIQLCTINPARALKMDHRLGSFEPGKAPGINLITHIDFKEMKLTEKSELKVII